jgi:hypothetical protein
MSKTRKKRIFGMTIAQFGVLAFLGAIALGIAVGGFYYISGATLPGGNTTSPSPTFASQPTIAPDATELAELFPTDMLETGEDGIPSDWKQHTASRFEIWLPPQFESVNVVIERQERIESYRGQGYDFLANGLENDTFDYRFWFNFPQPDTVVYATRIIVKDDILPTYTLDEYVDEAYGAGLQGFQVVNRQEFTIQDLEARRILLDANLDGLSISMAEYVITDEVNLWVISCGSSLEEFFTWLPEFDRVARSFRLLY